MQRKLVDDGGNIYVAMMLVRSAYLNDDGNCLIPRTRTVEHKVKEARERARSCVSLWQLWCPEDDVTVLVRGAEKSCRWPRPVRKKTLDFLSATDKRAMGRG